MILVVYLSKGLGHICRLKFRQLYGVTMLRKEFLNSICILERESHAQCCLVLSLFCSQPDFHGQNIFWQEGRNGITHRDGECGILGA